MLSLRTHAIICAGIFAAIIVLAMLGNALHDNGIVEDGSTIQLTAMILFFGLTVARAGPDDRRAGGDHRRGIRLIGNTKPMRGVCGSRDRR